VLAGKFVGLPSHSALAVELTHLLVFWSQHLSFQLFAQYKCVLAMILVCV